MNLFVGAVVDNFNREKDAVIGGEVEMTPEQEEYIDQLRIMVNTRLLPRPTMPKGEGDWVLFRRQCYRIVMWDREGKHTGRDFDAIVSIMIMANVLNMSLYFWAAPDELQPVTTPILTPKLQLTPELHRPDRLCGGAIQYGDRP